jgi:hypothetical protein
MNKRLDNAFEAARRSLGEEAQEELASVVEHFVSMQTADPAELLTPEQCAELDRRMARPFEPADDERVRAIFARHGIQADF